MYTEKTPIASAVPMAIPVASAYGSIPLGDEEEYHRYKKKDCFWSVVTAPIQLTTWKLIIFHFANLILSILAFHLIVAGLMIGIALLPLCCIGIVVLRGVVYLVYWIAQVDALLNNLIADYNEHISVAFECPEGRFYHEGLRVTPAMSSFSRESLLAIIYYLFIKFPLSILVSISLFMVIFISGIFLSFPWTFSHEWHSNGIDVTLLGRHLTEYDAPFMLVLGVLGIYFSIFLLYMSGRIVQTITKFCTCESFCIYGYTHTGPRYPPGQMLQGQPTLFVQI